MSKSGIKVIDETPGSGALVQKGDRVRIVYHIQLNRGEMLVQDQSLIFTVGDRAVIAGLSHGIDGMRIGGSRRFKASPHLCYRERQGGGIPANAVLIVDIRRVEPAKPKT